MTISRLLCVLLLSALLPPTLTLALSSSEEAVAATAAPEPSRPSPDAVQPPARRRLLRAFDAALALLDAGDAAGAAAGFEAITQEVDWPEASFNAALGRYLAVDLTAAREHASRAAAGMPNDPLAAYLLALVLHDMGRHQDAVSATSQAAELLGETGDRALLARVSLLSGSSQLLLGRAAGAAEAYARALGLAREVEQPFLEASAQMGIGHLALAAGDQAAANEAFQAAGAVSGSGGEAARTPVALSRAEAAWRAGDVQGAGQALSETLASLEASELPVLAKAGLGVRIAALQWSLGQRSAAEKRITAAEETFTRAGALAGAADALVTRSAWAVTTGDLDRADALLARAVQAQSQLQVPVALASSRLARAQLLAESGDIKGAFALAEQSLAVFTELGAREGEQGASLVLAELHARSGALVEAGNAAVRAVQLAQDLGNPRLAAAARAEHAVVLARLGALDEARVEYELATVRTATSGSLLAPRSRVRLEVEMAAAYARAHQGAAGVRHGELAVAAASGEGAPSDLLPLAEEAVVAALLDEGKHVEALAFLDRRGIKDGRLREATLDRRGTELFNEGVDAYEAGDFGLAASRFRALIAEGSAPEGRVRSARDALQKVLSAQGAAALEAGKAQRAEEVWTEATENALAREDRASWATFLLLRAQVASDAGRAADAVKLAERCGAGAAELPDVSLSAKCWEFAGHAAFEADPVAARRAFENALAAWVSVPDSVARRAQLAYNLAVLDQEAGAAVLQARLRAAQALATEADDAELLAEVVLWIEQLETPDEP